MTPPSPRITVVLNETWNALHRTESSSSLRLFAEELDQHLHCCLGIAMTCQFAGHEDLARNLLDIGLPEDVTAFTEAWYTHRQVPDFMREVQLPDGTLQTRPSQQIAEAIEGEIATLNDVPYHKAASPENVLHQLIYLFDLLGIDLIIPSRIRSMYFARWRPEFTAYSRGFVDGKRQGETAAAREAQ